MPLPDIGRNLAVLDERIYVLDDNGLSIHEATPIVDPDSGNLIFRLLGSVAAPHDRGFLERSLFVGGTQAFASSNLGFIRIDITDPSNPFVAGEPDTQQEMVEAIVANGSGRILAATQGTMQTRLAAYDGRDPSDVSSLEAQIETPGIPREIALANGLAFVADGVRRIDFVAGEPFTGRGSFAIVNYLPFDVQGVPPTVSLVSPQDRDPNRPGIQLQAGERITLQARSEDDIQVRAVRLLLDGELVSEDVSFPWQLPTVNPTSNAVSFQIEAEDTGGNVGRSDEMTFEVIPDTTPPALVSSSPVDGATRGEDFRSLQFFFDEPIASADFVSAVTLTRVSDGHALAPAMVQLTGGGRVLVLDYGDVTAGEFRATLDQSRIRDLSGNPLGMGEVTISFSKTVGGAVWIAETGGSWHDARNWEGGVLPQAGEAVNLTIPEGGSVVYSEGAIETGTIRATQPLVIEGGELHAVSIEAADLTIRDGILSAESGITVERASGTGGLVRASTLAGTSADAVFEVEAGEFGFGGVQFEDIAIAEGLTLNILAGGSVRARGTFTNRGVINVGMGEDLPGILVLEGIESCDCGEVNLLGQIATLRWENNATKTFIGNSSIRLIGSSAIVSGSGGGDLVLGTGTTFSFDAAEAGTIQVVQTQQRLVIDGTLLVQGPETNAVITVGPDDIVDIRDGEIRVEQEAMLRVFNPLARGGSSGIMARSGAVLHLDGDWIGAGIVAEDVTLRLGGDFTLADIEALSRSNTPAVIVGRLDLEGGVLPPDESWPIEFGTLANGRINDPLALETEWLLNLDNMTIEVPFTPASQLVIKNDLILEADLTLSPVDSLPISISFDTEGEQVIRGNAAIQFEPGGFLPSALTPSFRSELVIESGITIEGGPATIGSAGRPLTLRGVIRASNPGETIAIVAEPFINDGGTIEELNGDSVTINGQ